MHTLWLSDFLFSAFVFCFLVGRRDVLLFSLLIPFCRRRQPRKNNIYILRCNLRNLIHYAWAGCVCVWALDCHRRSRRHRAEYFWFLNAVVAETKNTAINCQTQRWHNANKRTGRAACFLVVWDFFSQFRFCYPLESTFIRTFGTFSLATVDGKCEIWAANGANDVAVEMKKSKFIKTRHTRTSRTAQQRRWKVMNCEKNDLFTNWGED